MFTSGPAYYQRTILFLPTFFSNPSWICGLVSDGEDPGLPSGLQSGDPGKDENLGVMRESTPLPTHKVHVGSTTYVVNWSSCRGSFLMGLVPPSALGQWEEKGLLSVEIGCLVNLEMFIRPPNSTHEIMRCHSLPANIMTTKVVLRVLSSLQGLRKLLYANPMP